MGEAENSLIKALTPCHGSVKITNRHPHAFSLAWLIMFFSFVDIAMTTIALTLYDAIEATWHFAWLFHHDLWIVAVIGKLIIDFMIVAFAYRHSDKLWGITFLSVGGVMYSIITILNIHSMAVILLQ